MKQTTEQTNGNARVWMPEVGARVKLATWNDYVERKVSVWAWMRVEGIETVWFDTLPETRCELRVLNGDVPTGQVTIVPLSAIEKPIGWRERYTITTMADRVPAVLGWMARGITVRQSHYMPSCETAFQPMDNDETPNWKFAGNTVVDRVPADQCAELFQVVKIEQEWDVSVPAPCKYCVQGKRTVENNPVLVDRDTARCTFCGVVSGFSFTEPYHAAGSTYGKADTSQCAHTRQAAECWVCNGTGVGVRYLSEIPRKERNKVIAAMHAEGWTVTYRRGGEGGGSWVRERETVVKRFGQTVAEVCNAH